MVSRPRSHTLEDESIAALRLALPSAWVVHEYKKDYGIDIQLELFNDTGDALGLRCYGQLKATDASFENDTLSLDRDHFKYWANHSDPTLLLRYFADSKTFRWCWLHDVEWMLKETAKSVAVHRHLLEFDNANTPRRLLEFLQLRQQSLFRHPSSEVCVNVRTTNTKINVAQATAASLRKIVTVNILSISAQSQSPCHFEIALNKNLIAISYLGLPGFTVERSEEEGGAPIANLALFLIFLVAVRNNRLDIARTLATFQTSELLVAAKGNLEGLLIDGILRAVGIQDGIDILAKSMRALDDPIFFQKLQFVGAKIGLHLGQCDEWIRHLKSWDREPPFPDWAGACAYNLGNALSHKGENGEAIVAFERAATRDERYLGREYYWSELGAAYFENCEYEKAAASYRKAQSCTNASDYLWRVADADFHCGKFLEAKNGLEAWLQSETREDISYQLLVLCAATELVEDWKLLQVSPAPSPSSEIERIMSLEKTSDTDKCAYAIRTSIAAYPLDALINFNCGHYSRISGAFTISMHRYLIAALVQRGDFEAWAHAFASAIQAKHAEMVVVIAEIGIRYCGESFKECVFQIMRGDNRLSSSSVDQLRTMLDEIFAGVAQRQQLPAIFRVHQPDGQSHEHQFAK